MGRGQDALTYGAMGAAAGSVAGPLGAGLGGLGGAAYGYLTGDDGAEEALARDAEFERNLGRKYTYDANAYDPLGNGGPASDVYAGYGDLAAQGDHLVRNATQGNVRAAQEGTYYDAPPDVIAAMVDPRLGYTDAGLTLGAESRGYQVDSLGQLRDMAAGNGPSAAEELARRGAIDLQRAYGAAGENVSRTIGLASNAADLGYGNALAAQRRATTEGGLATQRAIQEATRRQLLTQSAMAASARGGDQGLARRAGMNNAALLGASGTARATGAYQSALRQSAQQAADAQRQAYSSQQAAGLQAAGAYEQALLQGGGAYEAMLSQGAQARSAEQIAAANAYQTGTGALRQSDLGVTQAGLSADTLALGTQAANADRTMQGQQYTAVNTLNNQQLNAGVESDYMARQQARDIANQQNRQQNTQLGLDTMQSGLGGQSQWAGIATDSRQRLEENQAAQKGAAQDRMAGYRASLTGGQVAVMQGQAQQQAATVGAAGTVLAAMLDDDDKPSSGLR